MQGDEYALQNGHTGQSPGRAQSINHEEWSIHSWGCFLHRWFGGQLKFGQIPPQSGDVVLCGVNSHLVILQTDEMWQSAIHAPYLQVKRTS